MYVQLEEGWGQSVMKLMWCSGFPEIYACLEGWGQSAMMTSVYVHCTIYATALEQWCYIALL